MENANLKNLRISELASMAALTEDIIFYNDHLKLGLKDGTITDLGSLHRNIMTELDNQGMGPSSL